MPKTPLRAFRIPDDEWQAAQDAAAARDESVSDVIRAKLRSYVRAVERQQRQQQQ